MNWKIKKKRTPKNWCRVWHGPAKVKGIKDEETHSKIRFTADKWRSVMTKTKRLYMGVFLLFLISLIMLKNVKANDALHLSISVVASISLK